MLIDVFKDLDTWVTRENTLSVEAGTSLIAHCEFKILGQLALFEAELNISLSVTGDLDAYTDATHSVRKHLDHLLKDHGMHLDLFSSEIWMPEETVYKDLYRGEYVNALVALPEYVLVSKALKAPERDGDIIVQYLATDPSPLFFELCKKYEVDLNRFLEDTSDT